MCLTSQGEQRDQNSSAGLLAFTATLASGHHDATVASSNPSLVLQSILHLSNHTVVTRRREDLGSVVTRSH